MISLFKVANAIACEYVAAGPNNRHTLVNIYGSGDIRVLEYPAIFPLAFYLELIPTFAEPTAVKLDVQINRKSRAYVVAEIGALPDNSSAYVIAMPPFPISVEKDSEVRIVASTEDGRKMVLAKKGVRIGTMPI